MSTPRILATAAMSLLLVTGCAVDQAAETTGQAPAIRGVNAQAGSVQLRNLMVVNNQDGYPAGADAALVVRLFNSGQQAVRLEAVGPGPASGNLIAPGRVAWHGPGGLPLTIAPMGCALLVPPAGGYLVAEKLTARFEYGFQLPITFTFSAGGSVTVPVPMAPPDLPSEPSLGASAGNDICSS